MDKRISAADTNAAFSKFVRHVEAGSPVPISKHTRPVAAPIRPSDL